MFARDILAKINVEVDTTIQVLFTPQVPALQGHHNYMIATVKNNLNSPRYSFFLYQKDWLSTFDQVP